MADDYELFNAAETVRLCACVCVRSPFRSQECPDPQVSAPQRAVPDAKSAVTTPRTGSRPQDENRKNMS